MEPCAPHTPIAPFGAPIVVCVLYLGEREPVALRHRRQAEDVFRRQEPGERRVTHALEAEQHRLRHAAVDLPRRERESQDAERIDFKPRDGAIAQIEPRFARAAAVSG